MEAKKKAPFDKVEKGLSFERRQDKYTSRATQLTTIFRFLRKNIATTSMVSEATGIPRPNITRFKRDLEQSGLLSEVRQGLCKITGHKAYFLTTNPDLFPKIPQQNLFSNKINTVSI